VAVGIEDVKLQACWWVLLFVDEQYHSAHISLAGLKGMERHWMKLLKDIAHDQKRMVGVQLPGPNYTKIPYSIKYYLCDTREGANVAQLSHPSQISYLLRN